MPRTKPEGAEPNEFEYAVLTDTWEGSKGAAFNAAYDFCQEFGWIDTVGQVTELGKRKISDYEGSKG